MGQMQLSFKGGKRERSGRKKIGTMRRITLTLPDEGWAFVDSQGSQVGATIRKIILDQMRQGGVT